MKRKRDPERSDTNHRGVQQSSLIITTTDENFPTDVIASSLPVLVDFWAPWCGPCRMVAPILEEIALEMKGKIRIAKLDIEKNQSTAYKYQVSSIPNFIFFKDGRLTDRTMGAMPKSAFLNFIDRNNSKDEDDPANTVAEDGAYLAITLIEGRVRVVKIQTDGSYTFVDGTNSQYNLFYAYTPEVISLREAIEELEHLINNPRCKEQDLHDFFERHPEFLLSADYKKVHSKIVLERQAGEVLIPDFFLEPFRNGDLCDLLELKLPGARVFTLKKGRFRFSAAVMEAAAQLREYATFFDEEKNRETVKERYGLRSYRPRMFVVLGRSGSLDPIERRRAESDLPGITLHTYDEVLARMRRKIS